MTIKKTLDYNIEGIPDNLLESKEAAVFRSRIFSAVDKLFEQTKLERIKFTVIASPNVDSDKTKFSSVEARNAVLSQNQDRDELSIEERAHRYQAESPVHSFDKLVFPEDLQTKIDYEVEAISLLSVVHNALNYKVIKPVPRRGLILGGPPGTGKTAMAHAIADKLKMPILSVTYADIASKFHGEGPQNLKAVFFAAQRDNALLHIEEADALSSQRLTEVNSGSEQAINSLRNQFFSCLDVFPVLTICTTNFVESFDKALETRLRFLSIPMPDEKSRQKIWHNCLHLPGSFQLADDVSVDELAKVEDVCGREIADAVEDAAIKALLQAKKLGKDLTKGIIEQSALLKAIEDAKARRFANQEKRKLRPEEKEEVSKKIQAVLSNKTSEVKESCYEEPTLLK